MWYVECGPAPTDGVGLSATRRSELPSRPSAAAATGPVCTSDDAAGAGDLSLPRHRPRPSTARRSVGRSEAAIDVETDPETGVATGLPEAAICVQDVDVQCVLQFTLIHAAGCALHRHASQVIHRLECFSFSFLSVRVAERRTNRRPFVLSLVRFRSTVRRGG